MRIKHDQRSESIILNTLLQLSLQGLGIKLICRSKMNLKVLTTEACPIVSSPSQA